MASLLEAITELAEAAKLAERTSGKASADIILAESLAIGMKAAAEACVEESKQQLRDDVDQSITSITPSPLDE